MYASRGPNFYPLEGHDWLPTDDIRKEAKHNLAQLAEKHIEDVRVVRSQLIGKLVACEAFKDGLGWAVFDEEVSEGGVATDGGQGVLILSRIRAGSPRIYGHAVPYMRIVTNEMIETDTGGGYVTRDISVSETGDAIYHMDVVEVIRDDEGEYSIDEAELEKTNGLVFLPLGNSLAVVGSKNDTTPLVPVRDPLAEFPEVMPYGFSKSEVDRMYALEQATQILQTILPLNPSYAFQMNAE